MKKNKVLIVIPNKLGPGGVSNYYREIEPYFSENVSYFERWVKNYPINQTKIYWLYKQFLTVFNYIKFLIFNNHNIVVLNLSLGKRNLLRELFYAQITRLFKRKVILFFRGWDKQIEGELDNSKIPNSLLSKVDACIVLADEFKVKLQEWGFNKTILLETTIVVDSLIQNNDFKEKINKKQINIMFLSRIVLAKGIYEAIKTLRILNDLQTDYEFYLHVVGDGDELENVKAYCDDQKVFKIIFYGYIVGDQKNEIFKKMDVFFFPSYYGEGMPNSLLQAMGSGLPIITRPVGGIKDFFENKKMGYVTQSKDPKVFAELILKLISDTEKMRKVGFYNYNYAKKHFMASKVAKRLEFKITNLE